MKFVQSGDPVGEVVSLEMLRKQVRNADDSGVFTADDDALLAQYLAAAVEWVQDVCHTVLLTTEFTATGDDFCLSFRGIPILRLSRSPMWTSWGPQEPSRIIRSRTTGWWSRIRQRFRA